MFTHKDHTITIDIQGRFCAEVNDQELRDVTLEGLKNQIDKVTKAKWRRVEGLLVCGTSVTRPYERITITSADESGHFRYKGGRLYDVAYRPNTKVQAELDRLAAIARKALKALADYVSNARANLLTPITIDDIREEA